MPAYRRKELVVSAEQWTGKMINGKFIIDNPPRGVIYTRKWYWPFKKIAYINTLEGKMYVKIPSPTEPRTDYIVTGIVGEIYPVKANIFEKTYDICSDWSCC